VRLQGAFAVVASGIVGLLALSISAVPAMAACPNEALRAGASAHLPDCRAYELVTPSETGGYYPMERTLSSPTQYFGLFAISPNGESVVFQTQQGAIPGLSGSGSDDRYQSVRTASGWSTSLDGPTAAQSETPGPGGVSADHGYSFVATRESGLPDRGSLNQQAGVTANESSTWLRRPDGEFELVGKGELADDPDACGDYIAPGASHVVFDTRDCSGNGSGGPQLLPDAPPSGISAVYDRTPGGLHTASLLPGDVTPTENAFFKGVSADGTAVLFSVGPNAAIGSGSTLYVRIDDARTLEVASGNGGPVAPAGASADGRYVFYVQGGDIFALDTSTGTTTTVVNTEDAQPVNIAADGSRVYFVSESEISGGGEAGKPNLYLWNASSGVTSFVATVDPSDVSGEPCLTCWTNGPAAPRMNFIEGPGTDTSRATADGAVLVFESHAQLTAYENAGADEIYRYDSSSGAINCVSCNSAGPTSGARLQSFNPFLPVGPPYAYLDVGNVTMDGSTVFFETAEALAPTDTDGAVDVYEWKEGTISLISSGHSPSDNYLYGVTPSGSDVIFATNDTLLPRDHTGGSGSIYDARVNGGFPEPVSASCQGDDCQGQPQAAQPPGAPATTTFVGRGNLRPHGSCGAYSHRARRLARRSRGLRRRADRQARLGRGRPVAMRRQARRLARRAHHLSQQAERCRDANRRAAR
jgi:hypothetical protein